MIVMERFQNAFQMKRYETALTLLNDISEILLEKRDHTAVLNRIIQEVSRFFDARAGSIAVPDSDDQHMRFIAGFNRKPSLMERLNTSQRLEIGEGVAGRAYANEDITGVSNVFEDNIFKPRFYEHADREGFKAVFSTPLVAFDTCIGVASFYFGNERNFKPSMRTIMEPIANQIAIATLQSDLIQDLEQTKARLKHQAQTDGLTGLPNQENIRDLLRSELERTNRYDVPVACIMADVDHFKAINDEYGHLVGDQVLETLAEQFRDEIRDIDAVGRYGGEEFLFVLPETGEEKARAFGTRLRQSVEQLTIEQPNADVRVTISMGVASNAGQSMYDDELIAQADAALLHAKQTGRNKVVPFSEVGRDQVNDDMPETYLPSV